MRVRASQGKLPRSLDRPSSSGRLANSSVQAGLPILMKPVGVAVHTWLTTSRPNAARGSYAVYRSRLNKPPKVEWFESRTTHIYYYVQARFRHCPHGV